MLGNVEVAVVNQQVARHIVNAGLANPPQQLPHPFNDQEWVAIALDEQITIQPAIVDIAERVDLRSPGIHRAKQIERDQRC